MDEQRSSDKEHESGAVGGVSVRLTSLRSTLFGAFGVMMVTITIASALSYVFSIIMTRMLSETGAFSSFNSLNSLFLIVSMGSSAFQTVVTRNVAEHEALGQRDKTRLMVHTFSRGLLWAGGIILLVSVAAAWPLSSALKLDSPLFVVIIGTYLATTLYLMLPYGLLQGQQRFVGLGVAGIAGAALRIAFGIALVAAGLGIYGALGAGTLAALCIVGAIVYYYRDYFRGKAPTTADFHPARALRPLVPVAMSVFLIVFMTQIDVVMMKAMKAPAVADLYSYGALAGKAVLFFPAGIFMVMFPRVSQMRARGQATGKVLAWSLAACVFLEAAFVGFYAIFPVFTASFFAGEHGKELSKLSGVAGIPFVVFFGGVMAIFAVVNLLIYYHLALDKRAFIGVLLAGAVAEVVGISLFHKTLPDVLLVMLLVACALLLVNLVMAFTERARGAATVGVEMLPEPGPQP